MRVIFMGTAAFAVPALNQLLQADDHTIVAVYTQPPRPAGRGYKETLSPVHALANEYNCEVNTPTSLKAESEHEQIRSYKADIIVVAAYGLLLPSTVLTAATHGCINIHPSLLPRWRGAAPIQHTIMAGDKETAVCIMQMDEGLDTGAILLQENLPLPSDITAPLLHDQCAELGGELVLKTLATLPNLTPQTQSEEGVTYAHKLTKEDGKIDWNQSAFEIDCLIRGLNPWPGTYTIINGEKIKIATADIIDQQGKAGTILDDQLTIACGKEALRPTFLQRPGKKLMARTDFLRGFNVPVNTVVGNS